MTWMHGELINNSLEKKVEHIIDTSNESYRMAIIVPTTSKGCHLPLQSLDELPLLTFLAAMAAIFGGLLVAWGYGGVSPEVFLSRLQNAIALNTFLVGLIKAPFMAGVIAVISAVEGLAVQGSAESLGKRVTASVVKAIFMVIVIDGLFAMFFAAIKY